MKILFLHPNFPAQFVRLAGTLASDPANRVVFGTQRQEGSLPNVFKVIYSNHREPNPDTHNYIRPLEGAVIQAQAVYRMGTQLKAQGFIPDVVYGHSGWGPTMLIKDLFPRTPLLCFFEWFYHAHGTDADFDPSQPLTPDDEARIRLKNTPILVDLYSCDRGISPTYWQHSQFPNEFQPKIDVIHDGIDTDYLQPQAGTSLVLPELGIDLTDAEEIITYVARGMEPYRGFPQFMEAVSLVMTRRPKCQVVVVGADRVAYGRQLPEGQSYKDLMLKKLQPDMSRLHFTGLLPFHKYRQVLQASSVHVYLTRPFVLSWSMLEAMSAGCLLVASDTQPVREVIRDGENGLLVDFFNPKNIADRICEALDNRSAMQRLRQNARQTILERYAAKDCLSKQIEILKSLL
jgi:glycosyltransferase involved in cell wall biosynthesis